MREWWRGPDIGQVRRLEQGVFAMADTRVQRYIIRRIRIAHCKKGPAACEKCREMDAERICLLDICPPDPGQVQRRIIEVEVDGEVMWCEFDVVRAFDSEQEAKEYAEREGIRDIEI